MATSQEKEISAIKKPRRTGLIIVHSLTVNGRRAVFVARHCHSRKKANEEMLHQCEWWCSNDAADPTRHPPAACVETARTALLVFEIGRDERGFAVVAQFHQLEEGVDLFRL